jgi:hypothetical protein
MLGLVAVALRSQALDLYVSTQGLDANPGTLLQPLRTIGRAYSLAVPGVTIIVMPGVYTDYTSGWGLHLDKSGTASSPIVLRSQVRGGAVIDGQNATDRNLGIYLDGSYHIIDGFEIKRGPMGGIKIWGSYNQILNNDIHHNGSADGPGQIGIYSDKITHHNVYKGNYIHDNGRPGANLDHAMYLCGDDEIVINNVMVRNAANGLQIAGYTTINNMKVYNNVCAFNGTSGIIVWMALSGVDIKNNIVYRNGTYGINSWEAHGSGVVIDQNLSFGNALGEYNLTRGGSDFTYTLGTLIQAEPGFVNSTSAGLDVHLTAGSPAIDAGAALTTVTNDIDGNPRPQGAGWDLGAYEYAGAIPPPLTNLYVSTQGLDGNPGSLAQPLRTITRAYSLAVPGVTIFVMPGVYTDHTSGWGLHLNKSGTASSPIVLRSQVKGAAVIDGQNAATRNLAIYLDGSYNVIDGFEIKGGPNGGIKIWGSYNQILNNEIHDNATVDGPSQLGVYSDRSTHHNIFKANYIHDNGRLALNLDHGMFLSGDEETVVNNVVVRNAANGLHVAGNGTVSGMKIYNNVIAYNGQNGVLLWTNLSGVDIKNNIFYRNIAYGITSSEAHGSGVVADRNLFFGNGAGEYDFTRGGSDFTYTLGTSISADPLFVNAASAGFDPHLSGGSPAIDVGAALTTVADDIDGKQRPQGSGWDIGAYEYGGSAAQPPAAPRNFKFSVNAQ